MLVSLFTSEDIRTSRDEGILVQISPLFTHQPWNLAQDFSCSKTMCLEDTTINMSSLMAESLFYSLPHLHPTPVPLPGRSYGWRSLLGYSPWGCSESAGMEEPARLQSMGSLRVCRDGGAC